MSMHRLGDQRARARSGGCGSARRRAGRRARRVASPTSLGIHSRSSSSGRVRGTSGPSPDGAAPQIRASDRNVFEVAAARSGGPARSRWPASRAISARICLRSARTVVLVGAPAREVARGPAGPRRAAATRPRRAPRRRRRRSPASRRRCRRPPAGRPTSRTSGVRRGRSAGPRPHRRAPRSSTPVRSCTCSSTSSELTASRTAEVAKASIVLAALVLGDPQRLGGERGQRVDPGLRDRTRRRRGARPAAAAACRSTPAAAPRRRARRPPAGARCWSRCRGRPARMGPTRTRRHRSA